MLPKLKEATKKETGSKGEFINDFCIRAKSHSLLNQNWNNIKGYIVGFEKERVCFQTGEEFLSKIILLKLEM